jgi:Tol biopolymer transport system component
MTRPAAGLGWLLLVVAPASAGLPLPAVPRLDARGHPLPPGAVARLGDYARRHGDVLAFSFSPDGKLVARSRTVGADIREAATGRDVTPAWVRKARGEVRFTPTGHLFHGDHPTGTYQVRRPDTGEVVLDASAPGRRLDRPQFLPAGGFVAAVRDRGGPATLRLFAGGDRGRVLADFGHARSYVYFPNGRWVVTDAVNGQGVHVYDAVAGQFFYFHPMPTDRGDLWTPLLPDPDSDTVLVGRVNGVVPLKLGRQAAEEGPVIPVGAVASLARGPDGRSVEATDYNGGVWRFGWPDPKPEPVLGPRPKPPEGWFRRASSPGGDREVLTSRDGGAARVVDAATGRTVFEYEPPSQVGRLDPRSAGRVVLRNRAVTREYAAATGRLLAERRVRFPPLGPGEQPWEVSPDGRLLVVYRDTRPAGRVSVRDLATGRELWGADQDITGGWPAFDPTGRTVIVTGNARTTWHEAESGRVVAELPGWCYPSPDGRLAVSVPPFDPMRVIELATGRVRTTLAGLPAFDSSRRLAGGFRFSADGRFLVGSGERYGVIVWSLADGSVVHTGMTRNPTGESPSGDISADGRWLAATGPGEMGVRVWDWNAPHGRSRDIWLFGHVGTVTHVTFTPDGKYLLTGGHDGTVLVWDVARFAERSRVPPDRADPDDLWGELGSDDAGVAGKAVAALVRRPAAAVEVARRGLAPAVTPPPFRLAALAAALGSDDPRARDRAEAELARLGDLAGPVLRQAARSDVPERRRRAERLLGRLDGPVRDPARLLVLRAVEVVERVGTADARQLLATWAGGAEPALLTREAKAALARLPDR